jgi:hypothetical protein
MESFLPLFLALPSFRAAAVSRGNSLRGNDVPPCEAPAAPTMPAHRSSSVATFAKTSLDGPVEIPRAPWEREFFGVNWKAGRQGNKPAWFLSSKWIRHSFDLSRDRPASSLPGEARRNRSQEADESASRARGTGGLGGGDDGARLEPGGPGGLRQPLSLSSPRSTPKTKPN